MFGSKTGGETKPEEMSTANPGTPEELKDELSQLMGSINGAKLELEERQEATRVATDEATSAAEKRDTTNEQLKNAKQSLKDTLAAQAEAQTKLNNLEKEAGALDEKIAIAMDEEEARQKSADQALTETNASFKKAKAKETEVMASLRAAREELTTVKADIKAKVEAGAKKLDEYDAKNERVLKTIAANEEKSEALTKEITSKEGKLDTVNAQLAEATADKEAQIAIETEIRGEIKEKTSTRDALDAEIAAKKAEIEQMDGDKLRFTAKKEALDAREAHIRDHYKQSGVVYPEIEA